MNSKLFGLVYVGAARSLDQTALRSTVCHQNNLSNDVKYITHMQSVLAKKKNGNVHKNEKKEETL